MISLSQVDPPAALDVLALVRDHLRLGNDTREDGRLRDLLIPGAVSDIEARTGRQLLTATWELTLPWFPAVLELPRPPVQSVSSVKYVDDAGTEQTVDSSVYVVTAPTGPTAGSGRITLAPGKVWPVPAVRLDAVRVRFITGYGTTASTVPAAILTALVLLVEAKFDEQADDALERAASRLLAPFRWRRELPA